MECETEGATDRTVCTASDINQTQTLPLQYVSSARTRRAFVHNIVRYMAATISYARRIRDRYRVIDMITTCSLAAG